MPARMAKGFSQEVTDFDRQMGCMAGMFQIFDRRRLLTSRQRGGSPGTGNELPPGHDLPGSSMYAQVHNSNPTPEKSFSKSTIEDSILSMESSRASSSSSSCSSLSSLSGSKPGQQELPYINEEPVVGRTVRSSRSLKYSNKEVKSKQKSTDFRDVVKDSINRDSGVLAIKTTMIAQRNGLHKDSPRPLLISKSTDGTYVIAIDRSSGLPAYVDESRRQPRFSCDDQQLLQQEEAQDSQMPSSNLRELPRLSLDSRKESVRPSSHLKNFCYAKTDDNLIDNLKSQESPSHQRASSVIVKLMGLEETPDSSGPARSNRQAHDIQNGHLSHIRNIHPDHSVLQPIVRPPILKIKPSAKIVPESVPWRQQERGITRYYDEARPRSASTYNDRERTQRRLRHLALSECNKDLKALRIVGNLHAKHTPCQRNYSVTLLPNQKATAEGNNTTAQDLQSPVVIIKPARGIMRSNASVAPLAGPKVHRKLQHEEHPLTKKSDTSDRKKTHSHNERAHSRAEEAVGRTASPLPSRSLSPRLVQKKSDCGRLPRVAVLPKSPAKTHEVVSPRGRLRSRASQANNICHDDKMSMIPESRIILSKKVDTGIIDYPNPLNVKTSCSHQSNTASTLNHEETPPTLSPRKKNIHPLENVPSPISVLDTTFCQDGLSPSLRSISNSFQDVATHTLDECWNPVSLPDTRTLKKNSDGNHIIPKNMKALIQKLELLQLLSYEAPITNDNLLMVAANKDHHYIYNILSVSGFLQSELSSRMMPYRFQLPSYPIDPEVFLILEQTKPAAGKLHRKVIFDLANELVAQKIHSDSSVRLPVQLIQCKKSSGWHLFKELCSEIEMLQSEASIIRFSEEEEEENKLAKNAVHEMGKWKCFNSELQGMVLDIERHIFKNLIDEFISSEAMRMV